ncbi:MAG: hypothetical protein AAGD43_08845 [Pseudomonadota bacterium]
MNSFLVGIVGAAIVSGFLIIQLYPDIAVPFANPPTGGSIKTTSEEQTRAASSSKAHENVSRSPAPLASSVLGSTSKDAKKTRSNPPITQLISPLADTSAGLLQHRPLSAQTQKQPAPEPQKTEIQAHQPLDPQRLASLAPSEPPRVKQAPLPPIPDHPNIGSLRWKKLNIAESGSTVSLPTRLFKRSLASPSNADKIWTTLDGRALLRFRQKSQVKPFEIAKLRRDLLELRYPRADLSNDSTTDRSLTVAGKLANERFQQRVMLSCNKRQSVSWTLVYPLSEQIFFEKVSNRMFRHIIRASKSGC